MDIVIISDSINYISKVPETNKKLSKTSEFKLNKDEHFKSKLRAARIKGGIKIQKANHPNSTEPVGVSKRHLAYKKVL